MINVIFTTGHKDWHTTFFKVPKLIDQLMEQYGGKRVAPPFLVDTATEDAILRLEDWEAHGLSHGLGLTLNAPHTARPLTVLFRDPPNTRKEYFQCQVRTVQLLTASESRKKIHIELELPVGVQYSVGYSVSILPINPKSTVQRALSRFHLAWDTYLKIESNLLQDFPTEYPISVADLLGAFVELSQTASVVVSLSPFTYLALLPSSPPRLLRPLIHTRCHGRISLFTRATPNSPVTSDKTGGLITTYRTSNRLPMRPTTSPRKLAFWVLPATSTRQKLLQNTCLYWICWNSSLPCRSPSRPTSAWYP